MNKVSTYTAILLMAVFTSSTSDWVPEKIIPPPPPNKVFVVTATGYNSLANQTDDSPFITATNDSVFWGGIAVSRPLLHKNKLPYGSVVKIKGFNHPFIVFDTMNKRYTEYRVDIWFKNYSHAIKMGVDTLVVTKIAQLPRNKIKEFPALMSTFEV